MDTFIALLRGINVSGQKLIKMAELRQSLSNLNYSTVETYIQSGNIVFNCQKSSFRDLEHEIHNIIKSDFGYDVSVQVLDPDELGRIIQKNPFKQEAETEPSRLFVARLVQLPEKTAMNRLLEHSSEQDQLVFTGEFLYLYCSKGAGKSKISTNFIESKLKTLTTMRNWNTVLKLKQMIEARNL